MKRGEPLRRLTPLKRGGPIALSPMRKNYIDKALGIETTVERKNRRRSERYLLQIAGPFDGYDHAEAIRRRGCILALLSGDGHRCEGPIQAAHVKPRSRGGIWSDQVGLCLLAHHEFDIQLSNSATLFRARYGVDLALEAEEASRGAMHRAESTPGRWDTLMARRMRRIKR